MNRRLGQPAINIYKDNETGKPKGVATLSYEEPICAKAAVEHFDGMMTRPKKKSSFVFHLIFNMKCSSIELSKAPILLYFPFPTGKEFQGQRIKVSMARRRPMMGGMRGGGSGMPMRDGMMPRGGECNVFVLKRSAEPEQQQQ